MYFPKTLTFSVVNACYAAEQIASEIGRDFEEVFTEITDMCIEAQKNGYDEDGRVTVVYYCHIDDPLPITCMEIPKIIEVEAYSACHETECPRYVNRLVPRKDWQVKPYWLRIRSNPFRRNYH